MAEKVWDALEVKREGRAVNGETRTPDEGLMVITQGPDPIDEEIRIHVNFRSLWTRHVRKRPFWRFF